MKSIKLGCAALMVAALGACGSNGQSEGGTIDQASALGVPRQPLPTESGTFSGHYVVPVPPNLAAAARYNVDRVDWLVGRGTVTLRYYLPIGLVGGSLEVELSGAFPQGATRVELKGSDGTTGTCTARETTVTCHEIFGDLGELPISMKVVTATAAQEYPGPVEDRIAVANVFSSDPIGFVDFDDVR